jgi:hypothetical protein
VSNSEDAWSRLQADVEVAGIEWLPEWNVPPAERRVTRPYCSVHWSPGAEHLLLPGDKVLRRETRSANQVSLIHLLERNGKIVAVADQVIWKMID